LCGGRIGFVVIGKNEGERLKRCLSSLPSPSNVVYVDSGSTDGSTDWARSHRFDVVVLNTERPFTAARARNAGFARLKAISPDIEFVHFIDGDCEMASDWPSRAMSFLDENKPVCAVFGRRRERFPERSLYNYLCDVEWNVPPGESRSFGGDVVIRVNALDQAGGYRGDLIAGEEPELCVRLRAAGWKVWRLDNEMTLHDAAMMHFSQWWRRSVRSGYAFAQGAKIHGSLPERHWVWESRRAIVWGAALPIVCLTLSLVFPPWGNLSWLIFPLQLLRRSWQISGTTRHRTMLACFELLSRFPEMVGQLKFRADNVLHRQRSAIEYK
jgi:glycosyltransferase involved in cell wall biosynthesis